MYSLLLFLLFLCVKCELLRERLTSQIKHHFCTLGFESFVTGLFQNSVLFRVSVKKEERGKRGEKRLCFIVMFKKVIAEEKRESEVKKIYILINTAMPIEQAPTQEKKKFRKEKREK